MTKEEFGFYLAGIIDSSLLIKMPKITGSLEKLNKVQLIIRMKLIDKLLLIEIKNYIDSLSKEIKISSFLIIIEDNYIDLVVRDYYQIMIIIELIRNKICTIEIIKINNLIMLLNKIKNSIFNGKEYNLSKIKIELFKFPFNNITNLLFNTNWLRGFFERKGLFSTQYLRIDNNNFELKTKYIINLTVKDINGFNNKILIKALSAYFKSSYRIDRNLYILIINNNIGIKKLIDYLNKFPLLTNKYDNFIDFKAMISYKKDIIYNKNKIVKLILKHKLNNS